MPLIASPGWAQERDSTLVVNAIAPQQTLSELDTPAAVSVINGDDMRANQPQINLSESLGVVPGLQVMNRQNYAQDLQLSVRGFGSRSTFGVRGVRIYVDGIPATMPDGQGQTSNIDLNSVESVSVLRGPFSALYGNASGGVVNIETEKGKNPPSVQASGYGGSNGTWRYGLKANGALGEGQQPGDLNYSVSTTRMTTEGYRDHSGARKNLANAKLGVQIDDVSSLTLLFNRVDINANDPGGLTPAQWREDPRQVASNVSLYNARKTIRQTQAGLRYQRQLSEQDDLSVMAWAGEREMTQFQSIPASVQQSQKHHSGGVIDLTRHYQGIDTRWTHQDSVFNVPLRFTTGINYETMTEHRKGYENFVTVGGQTDYGEQGNLRRDERNLMWNVDPYLQTQWQLTSKLSLDVGVRYSSVWFDSNDHYVTADNGDDSGDTAYHRWLPVASLKYDVTPALNVYVSAGRGFETPTITELSYSDPKQPASVNNYGLKPATSDTVELGSKWRVGNGLVTAALFQTDTQDEIVSYQNDEGRSLYQNAGKTRRRGVELSLDQQIAYDWRVQGAWTWLEATYRAGEVSEGNRLPGIARNMGYAALGWAPPEGFHAGVDVRYMGSIEANDANTVSAPSWTIAGVNAGYRWSRDSLDVDLYSRIDNLFDRNYIGSVIVNESSGRYYEPAPGRSFGVGVNIAWHFE
ncbi:TonB-dependent siderophore receptor [Enterobacterales bacterium CwR94]|nr:TonB-dependent siderophore receptor [Enterobacterales bacterium CwR94]